MNGRQRTLQALLFGKPDRVPLAPGYGRKSTLANWHRQGLPENITDYNAYAYQLAGGALDITSKASGLPVDQKMNPLFEEKIIEERPDSRIVQDWKGNICEIGKEFGPEYLRYAMDFVTRSWIKCPVENRADWEDMKRRYDAHEPSRIGADFHERALDRDEKYLSIHLSGPFWQLREWVGFENLCIMFYDERALVEEMIEFWQEYVVQLMQRAFEIVVPDEIHISEDMAYKENPMISPAMAREFMLPTWKRWGEVLSSAGVRVYALDSDGYIEDLIPVWIDAGINVCDPMEVAAGNDLNRMRQRFGREMAYRGGVDKRAMAAGGKAIEEEIARLQPVIDDGGYIPGCDHGVPSDVTWPNYARYVELLARATGWL